VIHTEEVVELISLGHLWCSLPDEAPDGSPVISKAIIDPGAVSDGLLQVFVAARGSRFPGSAGDGAGWTALLLQSPPFS
jgi:hypothetical protein